MTASLATAASPAAAVNYDGRRFRPLDGDPLATGPGGAGPSGGGPSGAVPAGGEVHAGGGQSGGGQSGGGQSGGAVPSGRWHQDGDLVWVEIGGGPVRAGRLVGRADPDGTLHAAYCMALAGGELVAGRCTSVPTVLADGRLRLEERWQRIDGTTGVSWIEEVRNDEN